MMFFFILDCNQDERTSPWVSAQRWNYSKGTAQVIPSKNMLKHHCVDIMRTLTTTSCIGICVQVCVQMSAACGNESRVWVGREMMKYCEPHKDTQQ